MEIPSAKIHVAEWLKSPPTIDGDLNDWQGVTPIPLNQIQIQAVHPYGGEEDLSARLYLGYDDENLYLACETRDNVFHQPYSGGEIWQGDCLQFVIHNEAAKGVQNDYAFALLPSGKPYVHCFKSAVRFADLKDMVLAIKYKGKGKPVTVTDQAASNIKADDHGLVYEAKIPFKFIAPLKLADGSLKLNAIVLDNDGYGLKQYLAWQKGENQQWKPPSACGRVFLGKDAYAQAKALSTYAIFIPNEKPYYVEKLDSPQKLIIYSPQDAKAELAVALNGRTENKEIFNGRFPLQLKEGVNSYAINWDSQIKECRQGNYDADFLLHSQKNKILAHEIKTFLLLTKQGIEKKVALLKERQAVFRSQLERAEALGLDVSLSKVALATINVFLPTYSYPGRHAFAEEETRWLESDLKGNRLFRANRSVDFLLRICEEGSREVCEMMETPKKQPTVLRYDLRNITIKNGYFYSGETPCFFFGPCNWGAPGDLISQQFIDLGYNLVMPFNGMSYSLKSISKDEETVEIPDLTCFDKALEIGLAVEPWPTPRVLPNWLIKKYPEVKQGKFGAISFCVDHPAVRKTFEKWLKTIAPMLKSKPAFLAYDFGHEETYDCRAPIHTEAFRGRMAEKYKDLAKLNELWKTNLNSFDEIWPPPENAGEADSFPHFQDWCLFAQQKLFEFYNFQKQIIREHDLKHPMYGTPRYCKDSYWQEAYQSGGDFELLCELSDYNSFDGDQWPDHDRYACDYWTANFAYDLFHSFDPNKTLGDAEWHAPGSWHRQGEEKTDEKAFSDFLRTGMWMAFVRGVGNIHFWHYHPLAKHCIDVSAMPWILYSMGRSSLEIRRLAHHLVKFSQAKAEAALLYSHYSTPDIPEHRSFHETDLRIVYEGTSFLDAKTTFVTERLAANGGLSQYKLVIIASAKRVTDTTYQKIVEYVENGGAVFIMGEDSLAFDEYEYPRKTVDLFCIAGAKIRINDISVFFKQRGKGRIYYLPSVPQPEQVGRLCDGLFNEIGIKRNLRLVSPTGENVWGVESRSVKTDNNKFLMYFININKEAIPIKIQGNGRIETLKDLIYETVEKTGEMRLLPMTPYLFEVDMCK
ncbi:MAG: beta-galactosidase [Verrucomicrobiae bacterium]|nr:beta-galactosidase [Verrucomicrobiae bacterium]